MVTFQKLSVVEEQSRRARYNNRAWQRARNAELWYMRVRYAIREGKNGERKLAIYKRLFPEYLSYIEVLQELIKQ